MVETDSEDSDNEGGLGNINRAVMRPPKHSGKAKKGHLCFDASFETDFEYDLCIRPDSCNPRYRMWFNFTVDNTRSDQRVIFNIVNLSSTRNSFCDKMTPLVRSTSNKKWSRIPAERVYYHRSPIHNLHYVLTISFSFDKEEECYQFAFNYPYSYTKVQTYIEFLEQKNLPFFKREFLANSIKMRAVDLLTITNSTSKTLVQGQRTIIILSRIHPGDSPASFVCQGIIDFLVSNHLIAVALRHSIVFKIIPMVNPDGVVLGNYRCNLLGLDLDRAWTNISPFIHSTLFAINKTICSLNRDKNLQVDFLLDLHAHSNLNGVFVHGNNYPDVYRNERHILFPKLLARYVDGFEASSTLFNNDPKKKGSARRYFCSVLKETTNSYSIYTSCNGYVHKKTKKFISFNEEGYYRVGRSIIRALYEYYKFIGVIPTDPIPIQKEQLEINKISKRVKRKFIKAGIRRKRRRKHRMVKVKKKCRMKNNTPIFGQVTSVELKPKQNLKKGCINFTNIVFPDIQFKKVVAKRKFRTYNSKNWFIKLRSKSNDIISSQTITCESALKIRSILKD